MHRDGATLMVEIRRTRRQWWVTARRLDGCHPGYRAAGEQVSRALQTHVNACTEARVTVQFTEEEAAVILARAPLSAWWMPMPTAWLVSPVDAAQAEAEAIIGAILRAQRPGQEAAKGGATAERGAARAG